MSELERENIECDMAEGSWGRGIKKAASGGILLVGLWGCHWAEAGRHRLEFLS